MSEAAQGLIILISLIMVAISAAILFFDWFD